MKKSIKQRSELQNKTLRKKRQKKQTDSDSEGNDTCLFCNELYTKIKQGDACAGIDENDDEFYLSILSVEK